MSNLAINIRILWWHFQVTFDGKCRFRVNPFLVDKKKEVILAPIAIYDFSPWKINKKGKLK